MLDSVFSLAGMMVAGNPEQAHVIICAGLALIHTDEAISDIRRRSWRPAVRSVLEASFYISLALILGIKPAL